MDKTKYFIIGFNNSLCYEYSLYFALSIPGDIHLGRLTTTDPYYKVSRMYKYFTKREINEIFENNEFVFLHDGQGLMKTTLEENNMFVLSVEDFLLLPEYVSDKYDVCLLWFDTTKSERQQNYEKSDKHIDFDSIESFELSVMHQFTLALKGQKMIYFKDESDIERLAVLMQYIREESPEKRRKFLCTDFF